MNISGLKPSGWVALAGSLLLFSCTATPEAPINSSQGETQHESATPPPETPLPAEDIAEDQAPANETSPDETPAALPITIRSGFFVGGEHYTSGEVRILQQHGKAIVELGGDFQTQSGPDLKVILHRASNLLGTTTPPDFPIQAGDYIVLGALKSNTGAQTYAVPDQVNVEEYNSVAIWCQTYNATFGAAQLT